MNKCMKRKREGVRVLSARSATTGGGNALLANFAAERSAAIVCRGRSPQGQLGNGATRCQCTGQQGAKERGNDVPKHSNWWAGTSRTGVETGVQNTGALERCWGAEHCWDLGTAGVRAIRGPRKSDGVLSGKGGHSRAQEHREANRLESEVVDALGRLSAGRR